MPMTHLPARRPVRDQDARALIEAPSMKPIDLPTRLEADGTQSLSLLAMLDAVTGPPTTEELAKARTLLTQRFGAVPNEQWAALVDSIQRRGWSADRFAFAVRRVLEQPFKKWNLADFGEAEPRNDIQLHDYVWVQLEVAKDATAMARMQGYAISGTSMTWWRYADAQPLPAFCRLIFDRGAAFAALERSEHSDGMHDGMHDEIHSGRAPVLARQVPTPAEAVAVAADVARQLIEANAELAALRAEITRLAAENDALHRELHERGLHARAAEGDA